MARATDETGRTQPATVAFNRLGSLFWATIEHAVTVTGDVPAVRSSQL